MGMRKIITINRDKCDGCGQCASACAEGAIEIRDGKARLVSETYCDGLGACLGECPQGAIQIVDREAQEFDEIAVKKHLGAQAHGHVHTHQHSSAGGHEGCPGSALREFSGREAPAAAIHSAHVQSRLSQWPVQMMLVPASAPFLKGADLLICADCVPFAVADFHERYLANRSILIGCPKLDDIGLYREKLAEIFAHAKPARVTVLRMEVPCCGALARAVIEARDEAAPAMPVEIHTVGIQAGIHRETVPISTRSAGGG